MLAPTQVDPLRRTASELLRGAALGLLKFCAAAMLSAVLNVVALGLVLRWTGLNTPAVGSVVLPGQFVLNFVVAAVWGQRRRRAAALGALAGYALLPALFIFVWLVALAGAAD